MPIDLLAKLKKLQYQRSDSSPFANHIEFHTWADKVLPLLSFDQKLYNRFRSIVLATNSARILKSTQQEVENINTAIGMLNQAITSLEVMPVPNPAQNPTAKDTESKVKFLSIPKGSALTRIAFEVFALVVGMSALFLVRQHLGIPL